MEQFSFTLYVSGKQGLDQVAQVNLARMCETFFGQCYTIMIVDVEQEPDLAERDKVFATPTLVVNSPLPKKRVVGDLTSAEQVLSALALLRAQPAVDEGRPRERLLQPK